MNYLGYKAYMGDSLSYLDLLLIYSNSGHQVVLKLSNRVTHTLLS